MDKELTVLVIANPADSFRGSACFCLDRMGVVNVPCDDYYQAAGYILENRSGDILALMSAGSVGDEAYRFIDHFKAYRGFKCCIVSGSENGDVSRPFENGDVVYISDISQLQRLAAGFGGAHKNRGSNVRSSTFGEKHFNCRGEQADMQYKVTLTKAEIEALFGS